MLETHAIISVGETSADQLNLYLSQNNTTQNNDSGNTVLSVKTLLRQNIENQG